MPTKHGSLMMSRYLILLVITALHFFFSFFPASALPVTRPVQGYYPCHGCIHTAARRIPLLSLDCAGGSDYFFWSGSQLHLFDRGWGCWRKGVHRTWTTSPAVRMTRFFPIYLLFICSLSLSIISFVFNHEPCTRIALHGGLRRVERFVGIWMLVLCWHFTPCTFCSFICNLPRTLSYLQGTQNIVFFCVGCFRAFFFVLFCSILLSYFLSFFGHSSFFVSFSLPLQIPSLGEHIAVFIHSPRLSSNPPR